MKKRKFKIPIKITVIILILLSVAFIFFRMLSEFLYTAEYFNIRTIKINDPNIDLSYLNGKNIFTINLNSETQEILTTYPNYHKVKMVRRLPNCISVELKIREALAYVRLYRYFAVDEEAVLFNLDNNNYLDPNLPIILGLENKIFGPKVGRKYYDVKELALCLDLINEFKRVRGLKGYRIKKMDVSSLTNLSFYISENIEIKIGESNFTRKLGLLNSMLARLNADLDRIKYIDLRFKEPVAKYRNEK